MKSTLSQSFVFIRQNEDLDYSQGDTMKILLKNARILSMDGNEEIVRGDIVTDGSRIAYLGPSAPKGPYDKTIDCQGNLLLPGFKNAHAHSAMSFSRSLADDLALHDWLFEKIFPLEGKLKSQDQYYLSKVSILEYLSGGITACFDMYYNPEEMARASIDMGFRTVLLGTVTKYRESVAEMKKSFKRINGRNPLVSYRLGFHAEYTCSEEILSELSKAAHELHCPIYAHNSEAAPEVKECIARHGLTPTQYMEKLGLFDFGGGGFHCVYLDEKDVEIFKRRGLYVVTCPGSNSKLASGIAPITRYEKAGLGLAIGTDGAGSNNALDFFYEMRLTSVLQKILTSSPESMDALKVLKMATVGGAQAMGLSDCDVLALGKQADIVMIDLHKPEMQPLNNIAKNLVYSGSKSDVKMTMIAGRILYLDGVYHVGESVEGIYRRAQLVTDRLKAS
jgi:5-methylthioadenosine/S-adenosylhomocysteine deaminase